MTGNKSVSQWLKKKKKWHPNKNSGKWKEDEITDLSCIYNKGV